MSNVTRIPLALLQRHAAKRPAGYLDAARACGRVDGDHLVVDESSACWQDLRAAHPRPQRPAPAAIPPGQQISLKELLASAPPPPPPAAAAAEPEPGSLTAGRIAHGAVGIVRAVLNQAGLAWWNRKFKRMVDHRTSRCATCPHAVLSAGGVLERCGLCGCMTWAKIRNPQEECPDTPPRWKRTPLRVLPAGRVERP